MNVRPAAADPSVPIDDNAPAPAAAQQQAQQQPTAATPPTPPSAPDSGRRPAEPSRGRDLIGGATESGGPVLVRAYAGFGTTAEFDPATGTLRAGNTVGAVPVGVYGQLGDTVVVFYRSGTRLGLRIGTQSIELDGRVDIEWRQPAERTTGLTVLTDGVQTFAVEYRALPADLDLGKLISEVWADPDRRARIFTR
ncbi:hypothetical protein ACWF9G_00775 [Nocardia sp. NPDC055029]